MMTPRSETPATYRGVAQSAVMTPETTGRTLHQPRTLDQSSKLKDVLYEIRGPVMARANQLEAEGHSILKLNIGNPAPFGF